MASLAGGRDGGVEVVALGRVAMVRVHRHCIKVYVSREGRLTADIREAPSAGDRMGREEIMRLRV